MNKTLIKEIFTSIQGEGPYIGEAQIFVRFCNCNLNCKYCDTDFKRDKNTKLYSPSELAQELLHKEVSTVSLTGGEPLCEVKFLKEFLPLISIHKKIYLETNGTMTNELEQVIKFTDVISADIKLKSVTGQENQFEINDDFLSVAKQKECFIKVVFDENIEKEEVSKVIETARKHDLLLVLQPVMVGNNFKTDIKKIMEIFKIFSSIYPKTRLIPQVHKFLKVL